MNGSCIKKHWLVLLSCMLALMVPYTGNCHAQLLFTAKICTENFCLITKQLYNFFKLCVKHCIHVEYTMYFCIPQ